MAHGILIESKIAAKDIDALNRSVVAEEDVDAGSLLALTAPTKVGSDVWTAEAPSADALTGLWLAYMPTNRITKIDDLEFAGLSVDDRRYTNLANKTFDAFKPKVGDEIEVSFDCVVEADKDAVVDGDFLESKAGEFKLARKTKATGATAGHTAFQVEYTKKYRFPKTHGIGDVDVKFFRAVCVAE